MPADELPERIVTVLRLLEEKPDYIRGLVRRTGFGLSSVTTYIGTLKGRRLIEVAETPGPSRARVYYRITKKGLKHLDPGYLGNGPFKHLRAAPGSSTTLCGLENQKPHLRRIVGGQVAVRPLCSECAQKSTQVVL